MHLADALELREFAEHKANRLACAQIRLQGDPVMPELHVSDGHTEE
jgi:hypothetical protein